MEPQKDSARMFIAAFVANMKPTIGNGGVAHQQENIYTVFGVFTQYALLCNEIIKLLHATTWLNLRTLC